MALWLSLWHALFDALMVLVARTGSTPPRANAFLRAMQMQSPLGNVLQRRTGDWFWVVKKLCDLNLPLFFV